MRKPALERKAPHRAWTGVFHPSARPRAAAREPEPSFTPAGDEAEPAYEAVNNAYRVIDEYLREGQQVAEAFCVPLSEAKSSLPTMNRAVERLTRATGDMAMAWLEMVQQWAASGARPDADSVGPIGPFSAGGAARSVAEGTIAEHEPTHEAPASGLGLSVSVESNRPVTLSIELHPGATPGDLSIGPLHAQDAALPAILGVAFEDQRGSAPRLRIQIPNDSAPGVYNALMLDRVSQRPRGTVSVSIG